MRTPAAPPDADRRPVRRAWGALKNGEWGERVQNPFRGDGRRNAKASNPSFLSVAAFLPETFTCRGGRDKNSKKNFCQLPGKLILPRLLKEARWPGPRQPPSLRAAGGGRPAPLGREPSVGGDTAPSAGWAGGQMAPPHRAGIFFVRVCFS